MFPDIAICTATISTSGAISGTKSPGGTTFTIGTLIMMRVAVSVDRAVAAWPAPMFATSRSASRRGPLRVLVVAGCMLREVVISEKSGGVDDERGRAIAKDRCTAEQCFASRDAVELLDDDFLLAKKFVHDERRLLVGQLDEDNLPCALVRRRESHAVAKPDRREDVIANCDDLLAFHFLQHRLGKRERFEHVRQRNRVYLGIHARNECASDRERERQAHADVRAKSGIGMYLE